MELNTDLGIDLKSFWRPVGSTEIMVSPFVYGTVKFGRNQGVKYPKGFELPDDEAVRSLLAVAKEMGINTLDTAPAYGLSEERLGKLLGPSINDWVVSTKVGEEFENGESWFDFSAEHTRKSIHRSLKRLGREYLDVVMIHSNGEDLDIVNDGGALEELSKLKDEGLIRAFGMSTKTVDGALAAMSLVDCLMVTYHLGYEDEGAVIDAACAQQKGIFIKKSLASGHLVFNDPSALDKAIDFALSRAGVTALTLGTTSLNNLRANAQAVMNSLNAPD